MPCVTNMTFLKKLLCARGIHEPGPDRIACRGMKIRLGRAVRGIWVMGHCKHCKKYVDAFHSSLEG